MRNTAIKEFGLCLSMLPLGAQSVGAHAVTLWNEDAFDARVTAPASVNAAVAAAARNVPVTVIAATRQRRSLHVEACEEVGGSEAGDDLPPAGRGSRIVAAGPHNPQPPSSAAWRLTLPAWMRSRREGWRASSRSCRGPRRATFETPPPSSACSQTT